MVAQIPNFAISKCKINLTKKSIGAVAYTRRKLLEMRIASVGVTRRTPVSNRMKMPRVRKVVQISTMVHPDKDWAFVALCDDGSLWLYHGSWSPIEKIPQTTDP